MGKKIMKRSALIDTLDRATDKAASLAIERGLPIPGSNSKTWIGKACVKKNTLGYYDVMSLDQLVLFENIIVFDVATIVAQRYTRKEFRTIDKVLLLENKYSKHYNDMMHYLHCIKGAKTRKDYVTVSILEDKFQLAEQRAKIIKNDIAIFKIVG